MSCTEDNFIQKAGACKAAAEHGIALICPDTSPRGANIEGEEDGWDFGTGAGFYVNATEDKWSANYNMYDYVTKELPTLIESEFNVIPGKKSVMGHSMGGHGALICALKNPDAYASVSAFAPICNPTKCPWGEKAFTGYLGSVDAGKEYDATELVLASGPFASYDDILIDQGTADSFLPAGQLLPEKFEAACKEKGQNCTVRMQDGYDHSYYLMATFMEEHVAFHAKRLAA